MNVSKHDGTALWWPETISIVHYVDRDWAELHFDGLPMMAKAYISSDDILKQLGIKVKHFSVFDIRKQ